MPIRLLANGTYVDGFEYERFQFLDRGVTLRTRYKVNKLGKRSHAASVMTLVESLAVALTPDFAPVPRRAASDMVLNRHGLTPRGYVALHTGARHAINCWPLDHFYALAERPLAETS